jgi:hypothetical protein
MSLFKIVKYSSLLFFLGKYKSKLFSALGVLLFAAITSLLYADVAQFLQLQHPGIVIYALAAKIFIVYGSFAFVLWQFRPEPNAKNKKPIPEVKNTVDTRPLSALEDVTHTDRLRSRYDGILHGDGEQAD